MNQVKNRMLRQEVIPCPRCSSERTRLYIRKGEAMPSLITMAHLSRGRKALGDIYVCLDCMKIWKARS